MTDENIESPSSWLEKIRAKTRSIFVPRNGGAGRGFDALAAADRGTQWVAQAIQQQSLGFYGKVATVVLSAYFLSDVAAVFIGNWIPEKPAVFGYHPNTQARRRAIDDYNVIFTRNLFNSKGLIPGEDQPNQIMDNGGVPIKTNLPFTLVGTLILEDELRSIATIEDKEASMVYPVRVDDEIPNKAKIIKVEPRRVTFVNASSGRREYVELPEEAAPEGTPRITLGGAHPGASGIEQVSPNQFSISRAEVDKTLADLNTVLTQARAIPNFENGQPAGYKLFQIVPGSIYDKLGAKNGDAITAINGEPINDPGKAFELLNTIKTQSHVELTLKRDGKAITNAYDFK